MGSDHADGLSSANMRSAHQRVPKKDMSWKSQQQHQRCQDLSSKSSTGNPPSSPIHSALGQVCIDMSVLALALVCKFVFIYAIHVSDVQVFTGLIQFVCGKTCTQTCILFFFLNYSCTALNCPDRSCSDTEKGFWRVGGFVNSNNRASSVWDGLTHVCCGCSYNCHDL